MYTYLAQPLLWKRYIDDIFMIWPYGQGSLTEFVAHLNRNHNTIKFTVETSLTHISFLDITVSINHKTHELTTSLYTKPTDSHNYLLYSSEHPRHLLRGIPYSQFLRVRRICSNIINFRQHALTLASHFIRRGYPNDLVQKAFDKAELKDRSSILNKQKPTDDNKTESDKPESFYLVVTHNPKNPPVRNIVHNNWSLLSKSKTTGTLEDANLVFGLRRNKNLSDYLVRASTRTTTNNLTNMQ